MKPHLIPKSALPLFVLVLTYLFLGLSDFVGYFAYVIPSFCWIILAITTLKIYGLTNVHNNFSKNVSLLALLTAATQLTVLIFVSISTGFGKSPYNYNSIALNMLFFASTLTGTELARAQIIKSFPKRKKLVGLAIVTFLFAFIIFTPARYLSLGDPIETTKFLGGNFLPALSTSLLATFLALLGGPIASITYMGTLQGFEWLSPILPNPDWTIRALIGTIVPAFGFIIINQTLKPAMLLKHGLTTLREVNKKSHRKQKLSFGWITIAIIALVLLWSNSGLLGFQPSVIASGSMQPNLNVGDMAVVVHVKPETIQVGDVIQYRGSQEPIIHRVIDKYNEHGQLYFQTKGDANNAPDPNLISQQQVIGKAAIVIPKVGWASIYLRNAGSSIYNITVMLPQNIFLTFSWLTTSGVYVTVGLALAVLMYSVVANSRSRRNWAKNAK